MSARGSRSYCFCGAQRHFISNELRFSTATVYRYRHRRHSSETNIVQYAGVSKPHWIKRKNCCEQVLELVTVFRPLTTMGAEEFVHQTVGGLRFVVHRRVNPNA